MDQILNDETSLFGLTTLRDYDEYTFTHSVNVCIFAVALGRRLGLSKLQLYDLGLAALFHDIGKARVPVDVLNKSTALSEEEWRAIANHPWLGVLSLFQVRSAQDLPYRAMVVAYEHHMKTDLTGYPEAGTGPPHGHLQQDRRDRRRLRCRDVAPFLSDGPVDASGRAAGDAGQSETRHGSRSSSRRSSTCSASIRWARWSCWIRSSSGSCTPSIPNPEMMSRPIVRVVSDPQGNILFPGTLVDLAEANTAGTFVRTIIKTADPDRYGIRVSDYFV